ncbi:uncharacterized protein FIBRA_01708 [Fibroporia radiculosa]|uniref:DUF6534 domain-containing protein n=1 Tax=Fibroporia radiculosa TaxID=599839 RepID=J4HTS0_9APHY|nr:uncharacterized protein FIBRA_01708 [Fibroporia radiculosa]CCL99687.1 predicted protein [Fibroporia radiculosa]
MSAIAPPSIEEILGGFTVGIDIAVLLYGIVTAQVYFYWWTSQDDPRLLRTLVASVWCLESLHTAFCIHVNYHYTITDFGNLEDVLRVVWDNGATLIAGAMIAGLVQSFFIWRIWILSRRMIGDKHREGSLALLARRSVVITAILAEKLTNPALVFVIATGGLLWKPQTWLDFRASRADLITSTLGLGFSVILDALIAFSQVYYLWTSRTGYQATDNLIRTLMTYIINTGALTMLNARQRHNAERKQPSSFVDIEFRGDRGLSRPTQMPTGITLRFMAYTYEQPQSSEHRRRYLQTRILYDHLQQVAQDHASESSEISRGLSHASAIDLLESVAVTVNEAVDVDIASGDDGARTFRLGGISRDEVNSLTSTSSSLSRQNAAKLKSALKTTLLSIVDYYADDIVDNDPEVGDGLFESASRLLDEIRARQKWTLEHESLIRDQQERIQKLVGQINAIHPRLEEKLLYALTTLPPLVNATRTAQADVSAISIEAALLKLSILRARAHIALYGHSSPKAPGGTTNQALAAAYNKLHDRERAQENEERDLDGKLASYEGLLGLFDRQQGGFAQVVADMARVKKEAEECKKDLRRLGWTGD